MSDLPVPVASNAAAGNSSSEGQIAAVGASLGAGLIAVFYAFQGVWFWRHGQAVIVAGGDHRAVTIAALVADLLAVVLLVGVVVAGVLCRVTAAEVLGWPAVLAAGATSAMAFAVPGGWGKLGLFLCVILGGVINSLEEFTDPKKKS